MANLFEWVKSHKLVTGISSLVVVAALSNNQGNVVSQVTPTSQPVRAVVTALLPSSTPTIRPAPTGTKTPTLDWSKILKVSPSEALAIITAGARSGSLCHPSYPTVCIPPPPPDLDCKNVQFKRFKVIPPDPHNFDMDLDGIGCE